MDFDLGGYYVLPSIYLLLALLTRKTQWNKRLGKR